MDYEVKWRKSSHSGANGGDCVEIADLDRSIEVRDSKDPNGPHLTISRRALRDALASFLASEPEQDV
jgi:hypothetical protein